MPKPAFYETPELLAMGIDLYVEERKSKNLPPTLSGAALFLGFVDDSAMWDYSQKPGYGDVIKKLKAINKDILESNCMSGAGSTAGNIFLLKAHHGLQDKQVVEHKGIVVNMGGAWEDV